MIEQLPSKSTKKPLHRIWTFINAKILTVETLSIIFGFYVFVIIFPEFIVCLSRPFGSGDYFGGWLSNGFSKGEELLPRKIFQSLFNNIFNGNLFRPASFLFYHIEHAIFGGEFWAMEVVKFGLRALVALQIFCCARVLGASSLAGLVGVIFFCFHPIVFGLDAFTAEPIIGTFVLLVFWILFKYGWSKSRRFDLASFSSSEFIFLCLSWVGLILSKEIAIFFTGSFLVFIWMDSLIGKRKLFRASVLTGLTAIGLKLILNATGKNPVAPKGSFWSIWELLGRVQVCLKYLLPFDASSGWFWIFLFGLGSAFLVFCYKNYRRELYPVLMILLATLLFVIGLSAAPADRLSSIGVRHVLPAVITFSVALCLIVNSLPKFGNKILILFFCIFPALTGFSQLTNYTKALTSNYIHSDLITKIESVEEAGYKIYFWPDSETFFGVEQFTRRFRYDYYSEPVTTQNQVQLWSKESQTHEKFAVAVTGSFNYPALNTSLLDRLERIDGFLEGDVGFISRLAGSFTKVARSLGNNSSVRDEGFQDVTYNYLLYFSSSPVNKTIKDYKELQKSIFYAQGPLDVDLSTQDYKSIIYKNLKNSVTPILIVSGLKNKTSFPLLRGTIRSNTPFRIKVSGFDNENHLTYQAENLPGGITNSYTLSSQVDDRLWICQYNKQSRCLVEIISEPKTPMSHLEIENFHVQLVEVRKRNSSRRYGAFVR